MENMAFNVKKCKVRESVKKERSSWNFKMGSDLITKTEMKKDLDVIFQNELSPVNHTAKITETYKLFKNIRMAFHKMNENMMKKHCQ